MSERQKIIIGVVGLFSSGKDTVAEYLESKGFKITSLSDRIREECMEKLSVDREDITIPMLVKVGNELRQKSGNSILAERSLQKVQEWKDNRFVFTSLRHPDEVEFLKLNADKFILIRVITPIELRYEWSQARKKPEDRMSFEEFRALEEKQMSGSGSQQQLSKVISMADTVFINTSKKEDLYKLIDDFLKNIDK